MSTDDIRAEAQRREDKGLFYTDDARTGFIKGAVWAVTRPAPAADTETVARVIHESDLRSGRSGHDRASDAYNENAQALLARFHITERTDR